MEFWLIKAAAHKIKNQCESLKKDSAQRTESQAKAPGCRLRKKLPLGKDLLPGFARLFFLGQTVLEANNRVAGYLLTFILHHKPAAEDLMLLEDDWVWILAFPKQDLLAKNGIGKDMTPFSITQNHPRNGGLGRKLLLMHRHLGNVFDLPRSFFYSVI